MELLAAELPSAQFRARFSHSTAIDPACMPQIVLGSALLPQTTKQQNAS
jgi:hypothetical protein